MRQLELIDLIGFGGLFWQNAQQSKQLKRLDEQDDLYIPYFKEILRKLEEIRIMGKFSDIIYKIPATKENMEEITEICDKAMESLMRVDKASYDHAMHELEEIAYYISKEKAEQIVRAMKPTDKTVSGGEKWSYETVKEFVSKKGITENFVEWYLVFNMFWNDQSDVIKKYGTASIEEFVFDLSKNYIHDVDAGSFHVQKKFLQ